MQHSTPWMQGKQPHQQQPHQQQTQQQQTPKHAFAEHKTAPSSVTVAFRGALPYIFSCYKSRVCDRSVQLQQL
ncbi:hypothetical protein cyc_07487 [Cyclospora cayetanensis]|uniref:Uncharacterized protein n=1 Tax=Cyclospora cayetanensis TaxID=88456 RepID=A0A1D3D2K3_9EIME|nr:hypothetical protein cyc_07487 [Cyclospora cayetanensis]